MKKSAVTPRLILFCGHAGAGKTTLAKRALPIIAQRTGESFAFLDKDTVYGQYSSHVMQLTTGNAEDRDSPYYLDNLRDWEYSGLIDIVRENLALSVNVILVGPFSRELKSGKIFDFAALDLPTATHIRVAWIDLEGEQARKRMEKRADPRDNWKLEHWDAYMTRRVEPPVNPDLMRFDNTEFNTGKFEQLIRHLIS